MKYRGIIAITAIMVMALLLPTLPGCTKPVLADSYTAVVPSTLQAGSIQAVSVALFQGDSPTTGKVELALVKGEAEIASTEKTIKGMSRFYSMSNNCTVTF